MTLMQRRRALMGQKQEKRDILYQLLDQTFDGGEINTQFSPFESVENRSFAFDATVTAQKSTEGTGTNYWLIVVGTSALRLAKYSVSTYIVVYRGNNTYATLAEPGNGRIRFVINVEFGVSATIHFRKNSDSVITKTLSNNTIKTTTALLKCGNASSPENELPKGTLHSLTVRNRLMTADEINEFLEVES